MGPIELLETEHRLIETVISALETYCAAVEHGADVDPTDLERFVVFMQEYNDSIHHEKEEAILFKAMIDQGFPPDHGDIRTTLTEHHNGREYVKILADAAAVSPWDQQLRSTIADAGNGYAAMLRPHIIKEDRLLFPTAQINLSPESMRKVEAAFNAFERDNAARKAQLERTADELIERYHRQRANMLPC